MTAVAARPNTRAARLAARLSDTADRLSGLSLPLTQGWQGNARKDALARVKALGLPEKRDEYWRFTDPATLMDAVLPAALLAATDEPEVFGAIDRLRLVFVDGVFDSAASDPLTGEGLEIDRLATSADRDLHWARDLFGVLEAMGQHPVARPLAALTTARATDGVLIRVTGKVSRPVSIVYKRSATGAEAILHHVIRVEAGAELTLLENGPCAARASVNTEIDLAHGAVLHHVRAQGRDHERRMMTHLFARVAAEARLKSFTLSVNGALTRNDNVIWLMGEGGSAHVAGAAMGDTGFHHDDTVFVTHAAPGCESRQVFKKVLRGSAVGVFQGKILVKQIAQKTDGYQISQSLLLDEHCQFLAKPELEIYADDVKCSHGSTSGEIDPMQLYYLRARGIPEDQAKLLLVLSFLAQTLDEIEREDLADDMRDRLKGWLERHQG